MTWHVTADYAETYCWLAVLSDVVKAPLQCSIVLAHIVDYGDGSNRLPHWLGRGKRGQRRTVAEPFVAHDVVFGHYLQVVLGMRLCFPIDLLVYR